MTYHTPRDPKYTFWCWSCARSVIHACAGIMTIALDPKQRPGEFRCACRRCRAK